MAKSRKIRGRDRAYAYKHEYVPQTAPCPTPLKIPHGTRAEARLAKKQQIKDRGVRLSVYLCYCGCYHVGTLEHVSSRAQARAIAKRKLAQGK